MGSKNYQFTSQPVNKKNHTLTLHNLTNKDFLNNKILVILIQICSYAQIIAFLFACFAKYSSPSTKFTVFMDFFATLSRGYSFYWLSDSQSSGVKAFLYFIFLYMIFQTLLLGFAWFFYFKLVIFPKYLSICFGILSFCHQWLFFFPLNVFLLNYLNKDLEVPLSLTLDQSIEHFTRIILSMVSAIVNILLPIAYIFLLNDILPRQSSLAKTTSSFEIIYFLLRAILGICLGLINNGEGKLWFFLALSLFCGLILTYICYYKLPFYHLNSLRTTFIMIGFLLSTSGVMLITFIIIKSSNVKNDVIIPIMAFSLPLFARLYHQKLSSRFASILETPITRLKSPVEAIIKIMIYEEIFRNGIPKCEYEVNFELKEIKLLGIIKNFQSVLIERNSEEVFDNTEDFNNFEDYKKFNFGKIRRLLTKFMLELSIKHFPKSTLLRLFAASKLLESEESDTINNTYFILDEMDDKSLHFHYKKALATLRVEMKERLQELQNENPLNSHFTNVLKNEEKMDHLKTLILQKIGTSIQFWENFKSNTPGLKLLFNQATKLEKQKKLINRAWIGYNSEFSNYYYVHNLYYGLYKILNDQDYELGEKLINKYFKAQIQEQTELTQKNVEFTEKEFFHSDNLIFRVSGRKGPDLGKVIYCSGPLYTKLGFENDKLVGKNINSLMTPYLANCHNEFLQNFQKTGKTKIINKKNIFWVLNKEGFISSFHTFVQLSLDIHQGMTFLGILKEIYLSEDAIIILPNGAIDGVTKNIGKRLRLNPKKKYKIGDLCLDFQLLRSTSQERSEKQSSTIRTPQKLTVLEANSGFPKEDYFSVIQERLKDLWEGGMELSFVRLSKSGHSYNYHGTISERYLSTGVIRVLHLKSLQNNNELKKSIEEDNSGLEKLEEQDSEQKEIIDVEIKNIVSLQEVDVPEEGIKGFKYFEIPLLSPSDQNFPKSSFNILQNSQAGFLENPQSPSTHLKLYNDPDLQIIDSTRTIKDLGLKNSERDGYLPLESKYTQRLDALPSFRKATTLEDESHRLNHNINANEIDFHEQESITFLLNDDIKKKSETKPLRDLDQDRSSQYQTHHLSSSKLMRNFEVALKETNSSKIYRIIIILFALYSLATIILIGIRQVEYKNTIEMIRANTNIINVFVKRTEVVLENIRDLISIDLTVSDVVHDDYMALWGIPSYAALIAGDLKKNYLGIIEYNNQMQILVAELNTRFQLELAKKNVKWYHLDANPTEEISSNMNTFEAANQMALGTYKMYSFLETNNRGTLLSEVRLIIEGGLNDFLVANNQIPQILQSELESTIQRIIKIGSIVLGSSLAFVFVLIGLQVHYVVVQNKFKIDLLEKVFRIQPHQIEKLNQRLIFYEEILKKDYRNKNIILIMKEKVLDKQLDKKNSVKRPEDRSRKDHRILNYKGINLITNWITVMLFIIQSSFSLYYLTDVLNDKTLETREINLIGKQIAIRNKFSEASQVYTLFLAHLTTNPNLKALNQPLNEFFLSDLYKVAEIDGFLKYFKDADGELESKYAQLLKGDVCPFLEMSLEECEGSPAGIHRFGIAGLLTMTYQTIHNMYSRFQTNPNDLEFRHEIFTSDESNDYWSLFEYTLVPTFDILNDKVKEEIIEYKEHVLQSETNRAIFKILGWALITSVWFLLAYNLALRIKEIFNVLKVIPLKLIIENKALKFWLMKSSSKIHEALKMT